MFQSLPFLSLFPSLVISAYKEAFKTIISIYGVIDHFSLWRQAPVVQWVLFVSVVHKCFSFLLFFIEIQVWINYFIKKGFIQFSFSLSHILCLSHTTTSYHSLTSTHILSLLTPLTHFMLSLLSLTLTRYSHTHTHTLSRLSKTHSHT